MAPLYLLKHFVIYFDENQYQAYRANDIITKLHGFFSQ